MSKPEWLSVRVLFSENVEKNGKERSDISAWLRLPWPAVHIPQWEVLTRARAIENGICVCAVNMAGEYHGLKLGGHSLFIDPTGKVEAEAGDGEEILYGEYDEIRYRDLGKQLAVIRL